MCIFCNAEPAWALFNSTHYFTSLLIIDFCNLRWTPHLVLMSSLSAGGTLAPTGTAGRAGTAWTMNPGHTHGWEERQQYQSSSGCEGGRNQPTVCTRCCGRFCSCSSNDALGLPGWEAIPGSPTFGDIRLDILPCSISYVLEDLQ